MCLYVFEGCVLFMSVLYVFLYVWLYVRLYECFLCACVLCLFNLCVFRCMPLCLMCFLHKCVFSVFNVCSVVQYYTVYLFFCFNKNVDMTVIKKTINTSELQLYVFYGFSMMFFYCYIRLYVLLKVCMDV